MRFALLALLLAPGCSEKNGETVAGVCSARVNCPNERAPAKADECSDAAFDPACGEAYRAYFTCFQNNQVCDGRGLLDEDASAARCSDFADAYGKCVAPTGVDTGGNIDTAADDTSADDTGATAD